MSNNLFRKGLVAATIAGIAATAFAGAPAFADSNVLFVPTTGTGNTLISGETFSLTASLGSLVPADKASTFKFKVENTSGVAASVKINGQSIVTTATSDYATQNGRVTLVDGSKTAVSALGASDAVKVYGLGPAATTTGGQSPTYAVADGASTIQSGTSPVLTIGGVATTSAANYTVTAFLDTNNNGAIDTGEFSTSQVVHFVKAADAGAVVTFTKPVLSSSALKATVAFNSDLNLAQTAVRTYTVGFGVYGTTGDKTATGTAGADITTSLRPATYTAADGNFLTATGTITGSANAVAGTTYGAQLYVDGTAIGTEALQVVDATDSNSVSQLAPAISSNVRGSTTSYTVRTGTTSVALTATVKKKTSDTDYTQVAVGAGVPVKYTVAAYDNTNASYVFGTKPSDSTVKDTLSVNGTSLLSTATAAYTGTVLTDASGKISIPVVAGAGYAGSIVKISYTLPNGTVLSATNGLAAQTIISGNVTLTWADATATNVANVTNNTYVVKGGTITGTFNLADEFAAPITTADTFQLLVYLPGQTDGTTAPTVNNVYVPFVNGVASLSVADNSTGAGTNHVTYTLQKKVNGAWANQGNAVAADYNVLAAAPVAAAVTITTDASATAANNHLDTAATFANVDGRVAGATTPAADLNGTLVTVSGVVTNANGVGLAGVPVTVSAAGLQFKNGSVYSIGSATVISGANGAYSVGVYSQTAGTVTFTASAGSVSKTATATFASAASNAGKTLTITAPATLTPGQSVQVSVKLTDKYGNPVAVTNAEKTAAGPAVGPNDRTFKFSASTGVGTVGAAQTATDADGLATFVVTTGSADNGVITLTATYDADGAYTDITAAITATATIKVAAAAAAKTALAVGADQAQVGAAVDVIATATDAAGKAAAGVVVTFDNVGQGYLSATHATTDANGVAKVKLVGNVAGRNTLTATANGATAANAGVSFGAADANITVKGKRVTVTYEYAGLAKVVVSVNGVRKPAVYPADDNEGTFSFNLKAGTNKIAVSIAGKTVDSKTVKIKK
jgi:hypothetical protein